MIDRSPKLTTDQVGEIRELLADGSPDRAAIGRRYGVSDTTIAAIASGTLWKHITGPPAKPPGPKSNTGYFGVTGNGMMNRFQATITIDRRRVSLGVFRDPVEAARAYDAKAYGLGYPPEQLNFPVEET